MRWRWLLLPAISVPAALEVACSASNGDSIPSEVRDAEALDATTNDPTKRDSSSTPDEDGGTTPNDSGSKDAPSGDAPGDSGPSSETVRINEVYVERSGSGSKVEYIEIRGPVGVPIDDVFIRVLDSTGKQSAATPYAVASTGDKMPASGVWVIGGFAANVDAIITLPNGWDLDDSGAIQLLRGANKELVDVVGWTTDPDGGAIPQPGMNPKAVAEGKPFVLPATGTTSFGRVAGAADTNDNSKDFCVMNMSARAANGACQ